jgi:hypothetical protein
MEMFLLFKDYDDSQLMMHLMEFFFIPPRNSFLSSSKSNIIKERRVNNELRRF